MPISSQDAAAVARRHGLGLGDAAALQRLADTPDEAEDLAAQFAPDPDPRDMASKVHDRIRGVR